MKYLHSFFFVLLFSVSLFAQTDTLKVQLDDVLVTATKFPTEVQNISSSYSVIDKSYIHKTNTSTVLQLLREVPGISIAQQGGLGKLNSLFMRGANANHTLVLIDGVEVNDPSSPSNAFDLSNLQTSNIERIEIVRGPQSTLYGSDALAGIINVFTEQGSETNKFSLQTEGGSNSYYRGSGQLTGSYNLFNYSINFSRLATEGISTANEKYGNTEKDGYSNNSFSSFLSARVLDNLKFSINYRYTNSSADLDQGTKLGDDPNYTYDIEENIFNAAVNYDLFNSKWKQKFSGSVLRRISKSIDEPDDNNPGSSTNFTNATRTKFEWLNNLTFIPYNIITLGLETELEKANTEYISMGEWGPFESVFPSQQMRTNSAFLQNQLILDGGFSAIAGIRFDDNEKFGSHSTFRLGASFHFDKTSTKLKVNYGTGFKAPSLFYLFDPAFGNPELKPEENSGWDLGFEQYFFGSGFSFGATYFSMKFENMFGFDQNFVTININKAETKGIESFVTYKSNRFYAHLTYTYTDAVDLSNLEESRLIRRPKDKVTLTLSYNPIEKINLNSSIRYVGGREDDDFSTFPSTRITLSEYTIVDLAVNYKLIDNLNLFVRVENLFNTDYEEVLYYGSLGRTFYGGIYFEF
ncbi:MAG: TonB-dependent receptor [Melioribacteraceae bacterium]|nr:TonB-dependent receptor [Melioribacteraceae bacterium]